MDEDEGKYKMKETDTGWLVYQLVDGGSAWDGWDYHLVEEERFTGSFDQCVEYLRLKNDGKY